MSGNKVPIPAEFFEQGGKWYAKGTWGSLPVLAYEEVEGGKTVQTTYVLVGAEYVRIIRSNLSSQTGQLLVPQSSNNQVNLFQQSTQNNNNNIIQSSAPSQGSQPNHTPNLVFTASNQSQPNFISNVAISIPYNQNQGPLPVDSRPFGNLSIKPPNTPSHQNQSYQNSIISSLASPSSNEQQPQTHHISFNINNGQSNFNNSNQSPSQQQQSQQQQQMPAFSWGQQSIQAQPLQPQSPQHGPTGVSPISTIDQSFPGNGGNNPKPSYVNIINSNNSNILTSTNNNNGNGGGVSGPIGVLPPPVNSTSNQQPPSIIPINSQNIAPNPFGANNASIPSFQHNSAGSISSNVIPYSYISPVPPASSQDLSKWLLEKQFQSVTSRKDGSTPLHAAVVAGDLRIAQALLASNASLSELDQFSLTPCLLAAVLKHFEFVRLFYSHDKSVIHQRGKHNDTILGLAALGGDLETVKLAYNADPSQLSMAGGEAQDTPLTLASFNGHLDICKFLFEKGAKLNEGDDMDRQSLHIAVQKRKYEVVQWILSLNSPDANINFIDKKGNKPIYYALKMGIENMFQILLANGASLDDNDLDSDGDNAVLMAACGGNLPILKHVIENLKFSAFSSNKKTGQTATHRAAQFGAKSCLDYLYRTHAVSVTSSSSGGTSPLHVACKYGKMEIVHYIVQECLDDSNRIYVINSPDSKNFTPLHRAVMSDECEAVMEYLINKGANLHAKDKDGDSPLLLAAYMGNLVAVKWLINYKPSTLNDRNGFGCNVLHQSIRCSHSKIVDYLVDNGKCSPFDKTSETGETALDMAKRKQLTSIVTKLNQVASQMGVQQP